ncbi:TPA: CTP synthase, partial [Enterococcus faecium]
RHRHRYEFNNKYRQLFEEQGLVFSGVSPDNRLVEIVELPEKKFFVGCQFHPELISRPNRPQKLIKAFVGASLADHETK